MITRGKQRGLFWMCGVVLIASLPLPSPAADATWQQFRGPTGDGISDAKGLPVEWSENKNIAWKTPIHGKAWSSPVVLGKQIWLTTATEDGHKLFVLCIDSDSGKILKDIKLFDVDKPQFCHSFNSHASPTPVVEPGRVYVTFGAPGTACLDSETGEKIWERRDFVCNHFRGSGSSPTLFNDLLLLNFDGSDYQYIVAMDKSTGKTRWKTDRSVDYQDLGPDGKPKKDGDDRKAFSTNRISMLTGKPLVISVSSKAVYAYDPSDGAEVWRTENHRSHSGSVTPIIGDELIYFCTGFNNEELWAVKPGGRGVITDTHVAWKVSQNAPRKPSPLLVDGRIYMVDDGGIASCIDAKTGTDIWRHRLTGNYSASPLYADGKIYFFNEDGLTTVMEAGSSVKRVAENELDDGFLASPAVVNRALVLRTRTHLYRIENKPG